MIHYTGVTNALSLFIDDNSRFKAGSLKRLCQSLENVVGLKSDAFLQLANATRCIFLRENVRRLWR